MAFTTSNVRKAAFGDLKVTAGDWAETAAGQANVTSFSVEGGRVYFARFDSQDSSNGPDQEIPVFISSTNASSSTITLSIANRQVVTTGRFIVIHA
jgi:hypothetical protein